MPNTIKAKLIKLQSLQTVNYQRRMYIKEGQIIEGFFVNWPQVGLSFQIFEIHSDKLAFPIPTRTTEVKEIIDDRTFKTRNSIYKIVTLEDERDEKIKIIVE